MLINNINYISFLFNLLCWISRWVSSSLISLFRHLQSTYHCGINATFQPWYKAGIWTQNRHLWNKASWVLLCIWVFWRKKISHLQKSRAFCFIKINFLKVLNTATALPQSSKRTLSSRMCAPSCFAGTSLNLKAVLYSQSNNLPIKPASWLDLFWLFSSLIHCDLQLRMFFTLQTHGKDSHNLVKGWHTWLALQNPVFVSSGK